MTALHFPPVLTANESQRCQYSGLSQVRQVKSIIAAGFARGDGDTRGIRSILQIRGCIVKSVRIDSVHQPQQQFLVGFLGIVNQKSQFHRGVITHLNLKPQFLL